MSDISPEAIADLAPTGALRVAINLGNPVLAQGTPEAPRGVTVDLARELAGRLGVPLEMRSVDAARKSFNALKTGAADVIFLAIEPERATEVEFTAPYVLIEGVYLVPRGSPLTANSDVDRPGISIGVKEGSAYDFFLSRTLLHAEIVRGEDSVELFIKNGLSCAAGIRQPLAAYAKTHADMRLLDEPFMEIRQAMGMAKGRAAGARYLRGFIEEMKRSGFVAAALRRSEQDATVAPPA